jgi:subtilisin family serine protease
MFISCVLFLFVVCPHVVALRWTESDDLSRATTQQLAVWKRQGVGADDLESLSVHLESGRMSAWAEDIGVENTWIIKVKAFCDVDDVIADLRSISDDTSDDTSNDASQNTRKNGKNGGTKNGKKPGYSKILRKFSGRSLTGFTAVSSLTEVLDLLENNHCVDYIQQDWNATVNDIVEDETANQESTPPWGLKLIRDSNSSGTKQGAGVSIFVLDTPIFGGHQEFGGRVHGGADFTGSVVDGEKCDELGQHCMHGVVKDETICSSHGTQVAGIAAGVSVGVATEATIVAVAVMNCNGFGTDASVMAGMDYVIEYVENQPNQVSAVMVLSLGGPRPIPSFKDPTLDPKYILVDDASKLGVVVVVAAGNIGEDARYTSPAHLPNVVTVCGIDNTKTRKQSNYGQDVDICAPGVNIRTASSDGYTHVSGTSYAAPFVAGTLALFLQDYAWSTGLQFWELLVKCAVSVQVKMNIPTNIVVHNRLLKWGTDCAASTWKGTGYEPHVDSTNQWSGKWKLTEGTCELTPHCITSPNYEVTNYTRYEFCKFTHEPGVVKVEDFDVELGYDTLTVPDYPGVLSTGVVFSSSKRMNFTWYSDGDKQRKGWKLCDQDSDATITPIVPSTPTPPMPTKEPVSLPGIFRVFTGGNDGDHTRGKPK